MSELQKEIAVGVYRGLISFATLVLAAITIWILQNVIAEGLDISSWFLVPFGAFAIYGAGRLFKP